MGKISKSDQPINRNEHEEAAERAANPTRSTHFEVGTFVRIAHRGRAEVLASLRCKCYRSERAIQVRWEDTGEIEMLYPFALNPKPLTH
jgi:hypothetical protein